MRERETPTPYRDGHHESGPDRDVRSMHEPIMREKSEPRDGYEPIPLWLTFLYFGIIGWIGVYLGLYSAGFAPERYDHRPSARMVAADQNVKPEPIDPLVLGKRLYSNCISCHQSDGGGVEGQFPPLSGSEWLTQDPETPVRILLNGLSGPIEVAGETYNGEMPAFGRRFNDREIAAVLTYVRQSFGNGAPSVEPGLVGAVREQTDRTGSWSSGALREARKTEVEWSPEKSDGQGEEQSGQNELNGGGT